MLNINQVFDRISSTNFCTLKASSIVAKLLGLLFILRNKASSCDFKLTALGSCSSSLRGTNWLPVDNESL